MKKIFSFVFTTLLFAVSARQGTDAAIVANSINGISYSGTATDVPTNGGTLTDLGLLFTYSGVRSTGSGYDYAQLRVQSATGGSDYYRLSIGIEIPAGFSLQPGMYNNASSDGGTTNPFRPLLSFFSSFGTYPGQTTGRFQVFELGALPSGQLYGAVDAYQASTVDPNSNAFVSIRVNSNYLLTPAQTPEPSTTLMLAGVALLFTALWRRRQRTQTLQA